MTGDDSILPFQLDKAQMRGRVVRLDETLDQILEQHRYPPAVSALVAEAALLTALIGSTMKLRWRFSLQIRGEGDVHLIATDYFAPEQEGEPGKLRAYAGFDAEAVALSQKTPFELLGRGVFGVTIDQGPRTTPYQGITPLTGTKLGDCAEAYFAQSEQIATRFNTLSAHAQEPGGAMHWRAGGIMIQQLGQAGESVLADGPSGADGLMNADDVAAMGANEEDWNRVNMLLATVDAHELVGPHLAIEGLLTRLFHEEAPRVYTAKSVRFGCTCSAERVQAALAQYSAKDIAHMTNEEGKVTADCQFCSAHYEFEPDQLGFESITTQSIGAKR